MKVFISSIAALFGGGGGSTETGKNLIYKLMSS